MATRKKSRRTARRAAKAKNKTRAEARSKARARPGAKRSTRTARTPAAAGRARAARGRAPHVLPDLEVETTGGRRLRLSELRGRNVVIYFYPKDDTPGCTAEGCDIRDHYAEFQRLDAVVLGVSRDSLSSHERFKGKYGFPFELVSDHDERLCKLFDVIREKSLYGKKYLGVDRSSFVFDRTGTLRREFRGVKVAGHVEELLATLKTLEMPPAR